MKYHYQYVSAKSVRIELIPEDKKESILLEGSNTNMKDDAVLKKLFEVPLSTYAPNTNITKINFMDFPKVALVTFEKLAVSQETTV